MGWEWDAACRVCDYQAKTERQLFVHMKGMHLTNRPYRCDQCMRAYNTHNNRDTHVCTMHHLKPIRCKLCSYVADKEYKMIKHATIHSSQKFEYNHCDVALNSREAL